ncbi:MAG: glycosyltransferase family 2 protein [Nitrosopumilus sp.]|nr:glycosyltransferase family 2 protein [Nitrosopumilus sp.]
MISVIIPCYNSEDYVSRAIDSVLNQTYKNYEIILVDNNSTDTTFNVLEKYKAVYPDIIKVFQENKKGAAAARNKGLYQAKGEWIQFLDSDDELLPKKLEHQISLTKGSDINLIIGSWIKYKFKNEKLTTAIINADFKNVWRGLLLSKLGNTCSNLWKKNILEEINGWDENKTSSQEYDLMFRILKKGEKFAFSSLPLTIVHIRDNSIHRSNNKERIFEIFNNHIQLRLAIKSYLKLTGKLTKELNQVADVSIYNTINKAKTSIQIDFNEFIDIPQLDLPFLFHIKNRIKRIIQ